MKGHRFTQQLKASPTQPGIYLMRDAEARILYVGKATSLRKRLSSYFGSISKLEPKTRRMISKVADFEYIVTQTESEALILENTYIKRYRPRYNVRLKDDKSFPYIKIDLSETFPQVYLTRQIRSDGARYFGPFANAKSVRKTMALLKRLFPYRSCTKTITGTDSRPCLEYYIHRCVAPCIGAVDSKEYGEIVQEVILFLEGNHKTVTRDLRAKMNLASEQWNFERAASLRDQIHAIEQVAETQQQKVISHRNRDEDAIALALGEDEAWVEIFFIRHGKLVDRDNFIMEGTKAEAPKQILSDFLKQFYNSSLHIPKDILLQEMTNDRPVIEEWLSERRGRKVKLLTPKRGEKQRLVQMVANNAVQGLKQRQAKWLSDTSAIQQALEELQEALNLPNLPHRIECYDVSNIQGTNPTGSMVVFQNGRPNKAHYRRFKIKTIDGTNDYAMIQEMLRRRLRHLQPQFRYSDSNQPNGGHSNTGQPLEPDTTSQVWKIVPELVLVDGGKGHLSAALEVCLELGIDFIPLASIAKQREELFLPHTPEAILLPKGSEGLHLVKRIRDEAHRFAITYHRQRRSKASLRSVMDRIPGIGPRRKIHLLRRFGSIKGIQEASLEQIAEVSGITLSLARRVKAYL